MNPYRSLHTVIMMIGLLTPMAIALAGDEEKEQGESQEDPTDENMSNERLQAIIRRIDPEFTGRLGLWSLRIGNIDVQIITDERADRMRIIIPVRKAEELNSEEMYRILHANFDSALDARYAIGQGILWSTFIHPLSSLSDEDFLSGLGQSINIVSSYGKTYSSGALTYGGGDSNEIIQRQLLEELMKKGQII